MDTFNGRIMKDDDDGLGWRSLCRNHDGLMLNSIHDLDLLKKKRKKIVIFLDFCLISHLLNQY